VKRRRILDEEEVTSFVRARAGGVKIDAVIWVVVGSRELSRSWEGEEVTGFVSVGAQKMSGWAAGSVLVSRGLGMLVSLLPMRWVRTGWRGESCS
jgi:hypothetical protein